MNRRELPALRPLAGGEKLAEYLQAHAIEPDQKLRRAIEQAGGIPEIFDGHVFHALNRLNVISTRLLGLDSVPVAVREDHAFLFVSSTSKPTPYRDVIVGGNITAAVFNKALELRASPTTLGTRDFLKAVFLLSREHDLSWGERPRSADMIAVALGRDYHQPISDIPAANRLFEQLVSSTDGAEDFQYVLALERERLVFRVTSTLGDYVQRSDDGLLLPMRAVLAQHGRQFASFTVDQIAELEELLNSSRAKELDFQRFFDAYPHFLRRWDHREVHPQVYLTRIGDGPLIPDFILTDQRLQSALVVDLKLPRAKLVRRQPNRDRFSGAISEARAQLFQYRDWFGKMLQIAKLWLDSLVCACTVLASP